MKIMTILEAVVDRDKQNELRKRYDEIKKETLPTGLISSHLIKSVLDSNRWHIVTIWNSREELDAYRKSVEIPAWFAVFKSVGAEPTMTLFDIITSK